MKKTKHKGLVFNLLMPAAVVAAVSLSGCSGKTTYPHPPENESLSDLQDKYEHLEKPVSLSRDISASKSDFQKYLDASFDDLASYKSTLKKKEKKYLSRKYRKLDKTGKNAPLEEVVSGKYGSRSSNAGEKESKTEDLVDGKISKKNKLRYF